jgi:hypothetical protein
MSWSSRLWRRKRMEDHLERELRFHLEQHASDLIAGGRTPEQARRQARLALGGLEQVKEECRDARGTRRLDDAVQDTHYALRTFRQKPGFAAIAVTILARASAPPPSCSRWCTVFCSDRSRLRNQTDWSPSSDPWNSLGTTRPSCCASRMPAATARATDQRARELLHHHRSRGGAALIRAPLPAHSRAPRRRFATGTEGFGRYAALTI